MARILVIDDDEAIRQALRKALDQAGHKPFLASDGQEAMTLLGSACPDLVITDILMPEMEGLETIHALRQKRPALKIICISGGGEVRPESYLEVAQKLGADRTFCKPFDVRQLLAAVDELLSSGERAAPLPSS
jgi:DNA-binding response OmpR family regulator